VLSNKNDKHPAPTLLIGYGAYGKVLTPSFEPWHIALLTRGMKIAFAHVRGGGFYGESWHREGIQEKKNVSIEDFYTAAHFLKTQGISSEIHAYGRSAGALLVASTTLNHGEVFERVLLDSPLLDVRRAVSDTSLPLYKRERDEWGNPQSAPLVDQAMAKYSPMEQEIPNKLPKMLIRTGLHDKLTPLTDVENWLNRLTSKQLTTPYLHIMKGGHSGSTNTFDRIEDDTLAAIFFLGSAQ
jgi:oligopeptidase B